MKKEQKIIELRRAAKLKVAELKTRIAFARCRAAEERSEVMRERANELEGLKARSTKRLNVLAKYSAELAHVEWMLADTVAPLKAEIQHVKVECEQRCAAAEDDPEPENEQPQQQTVYVDGSEHSARIVARRLINKMPHIQKGGYLFVHVIRDDDDDFFVSVSARGKSPDDNIAEIFSKGTHTAESEAEFVEEAREMFTTDDEKNNSNSHVAEPLSHALDAVFGGNPVDEVDNIIDDTVKNGKEGGDE